LFHISGPGRKVTDLHTHASLIRKLLQFKLPEAQPPPIAPARIRRDEDRACLRIEASPFMAPPPAPSSSSCSSAPVSYNCFPSPHRSVRRRPAWPDVPLIAGGRGRRRDAQGRCRAGDNRLVCRPRRPIAARDLVEVAINLRASGHRSASAQTSPPQLIGAHKKLANLCVNGGWTLASARHERPTMDPVDLQHAPRPPKHADWDA
jgi:hypothetical protein